MFIETSLLFKTIIVLSSQLAIVLAGCFYALKMAKKAYENNSTFIGLSFRGSVNLKRKLDLIPYIKQKDTFPINRNEKKKRRNFGRIVFIFYI